jgi:hypothetical protein
MTIVEAQSYSLFSSTMYYDGSTRYNESGLTAKKIEVTVNYSDVKGNCFWDQEWNPAILMLKSGPVVKLKKVKLNFYANDVHFINKSGQELALDAGISKVVFFDRLDSTKVTAVFLELSALSGNKIHVFGQILNEGKFQLVKTSPTTTTTTQDPFSRQISYSFQTIHHYFLMNNGAVTELSDISKESLFAIIKPTEREIQWLKSNKNKLKNEKQAIDFLNFYNNN